jgi:hypothetical protein
MQGLGCSCKEGKVLLGRACSRGCRVRAANARHPQPLPPATFPLNPQPPAPRGWPHVADPGVLTLLSYEASVLLTPEDEAAYRAHRHRGFRLWPPRPGQGMAGAATAGSGEACGSSAPAAGQAGAGGQARTAGDAAGATPSAGAPPTGPPRRVVFVPLGAAPPPAAADSQGGGDGGSGGVDIVELPLPFCVPAKRFTTFGQRPGAPLDMDAPTNSSDHVVVSPMGLVSRKLKRLFKHLQVRPCGSGGASLGWALLL